MQYKELQVWILMDFAELLILFRSQQSGPSLQPFGHLLRWNVHDHCLSAFWYVIMCIYDICICAYLFREIVQCYIYIYVYIVIECTVII